MLIRSLCLLKPGNAKTISERDLERSGYGYALAAYVFWGVAPVYFVIVSFAAPLEVLVHRILWSVPLLALLVFGGRQIQKLPARTVLVLLGCSGLLTINWLTFIYGIHEGKIAETSLGYYLNPLFSVLLGATVLRESVSNVQWLATGVAGVGLLLEVMAVGYFPWIALTLAGSFALYGLLRRQIAVPAALGLGIETMALAPFALGYLLLSDLASDRDTGQLIWLGLGGVVTVVPLLLFGAAARRLPLTILGNIAYLGPTISLAIAVLYYGENIELGRWLSFTFVWAGVALFVYDSSTGRRPTSPAP